MFGRRQNIDRKNVDFQKWQTINGKYQLISKLLKLFSIKRIVGNYNVGVIKLSSFQLNILDR